MKKVVILVLALFNVQFLIYAQILTDSNLPILIISTDGEEEISGNKVIGDLKIIFRGEGERNFVTDQNTEEYLDYNGRIEIETRGSSSQILPKKQYSVTTIEADESNNNVSLLGMPKENDWILNGLAFDSSLVRDYLSYNIMRDMGHYAPRTVYCEVVINGDYTGLYVLQERIKADGDRVDISKISVNDTELPDLSGGYITKSDKVEGDDPAAAWVMNSVNFVHVVPKSGEVTSEQNDFIKGEFEKLQNTVQDGNTSFNDGYPSVIDIPSFIDFMIINELAANVDAYQFSTYFHKDKNGKLRAGPIWDFNLTYGNDLDLMWEFYFDRSHTDTWQFANGDNEGPDFWKNLFDDAEYKCYLSKRWNSLTTSGNVLNVNSLETRIDEVVALIGEASIREETRWGTVGDHSMEIDEMKTWLGERIVWMSDNIGDFSGCSSVETPPLVITKIHYHPTDQNAASSGDQEFIEILNNGDQTVDLTGVYFGGTGLVYQFPAGSTLASNEKVVLANSKGIYKFKYDEDPFDEYTRSLDNGGQSISLLDGFGNVIDEVTYDDKAPWPDADGNDMYLELTDPDLDNNDPANWVAVQDVALTLSVAEFNDQALGLYPNPTKDILSVSSLNPIKELLLFDLQGRQLESVQPSANNFDFNIEKYQNGIYLLKVVTDEGQILRRVIKE